MYNKFLREMKVGEKLTYLRRVVALIETIRHACLKAINLWIQYCILFFGDVFNVTRI